MATLSLTTHFTVDIPDDDSHTITGGSTTATDSITITHYFDKRYSIATGTGNVTTIWSDSLLADFDFLWIEADQTVQIQLMCNEDATGETSFVVQLIAGVPFCLASDFSRNSGSSGASDAWELTDWNDDVIDRIECVNTSGSTANVRVFAAT